MAEIQSMKHYNAIPILKVCPGKLTKVLRQEEVTHLEEKIALRKSLFTPSGPDHESLQLDSKKKAHFELRIVKLNLTKIGGELLELSKENLQLSWQFMEFPESIITSSNFKNEIIEFKLSILYNIEDYDSFSRFLEIHTVDFNLIVVKEENYIKMGSGQISLSRALSSPKSRIESQVKLFHVTANREEPILLGTLHIWYLLDFTKKIVSSLNRLLDENRTTDLNSLYKPPSFTHDTTRLSFTEVGSPKGSKESGELSHSSLSSHFYDIKVTDSEVTGFQEALFLVLNRNKALRTTQSEISRELRDRADWLNEEARWRRTLQEYAIISGRNPFEVQWRQWRDEDTSQVLVRSFPIRPEIYEPRLEITICDVLFFPHTTPYETDNINTIYVEYSFFHMDGPEMEAEKSLPIPPPNTETVFNFKRSYNIDPLNKNETPHFLSNLIQNRIPLRISVVGEPKTEEGLIQTCTEIGYTEMNLFEVIQLETNKERINYGILDATTKNVIGKMTIEINGILALRKMALSTLAPEDYDLVV